MNKEQVLKKISEIFPKADILALYYYGEGDSFEEFSECEIYSEMDDSYQSISDYEEIERFVNLKVSNENTVEDYIWEIFEKANNSPNFNNAGSYGTISFDIKNNIVKLSNTYKDYHYDDDGKIDWDQGDIENECETEEF